MVVMPLRVRLCCFPTRHRRFCLFRMPSLPNRGDVVFGLRCMWVCSRLRSPTAPQVELARFATATVPSCFRILLLLATGTRPYPLPHASAGYDVLFGYAFAFLQSPPLGQLPRLVTATVPSCFRILRCLACPVFLARRVR